MIFNGETFLCLGKIGHKQVCLKELISEVNGQNVHLARVDPLAVTFLALHFVEKCDATKLVHSFD